MDFNLTSEKRKNALQEISNLLEGYYENARSMDIAPDLDPKKIKGLARKFNFNQPMEINTAAEMVFNNLLKYDLHTQHPSYLGLFNPRTNFPSIVSELINAYFNPQLAAWSHAPYAVEIENYLIESFGEKFGFEKPNIDGTFTNGGAEANLTAIICALNKKFPKFSNKGFESFPSRPIIYCSDQSHHSIIKAARNVGLGLQSVARINSNSELKIDIDMLRIRICEDLKNGFTPFMIIGTAGTTGPGSIDDLEALAQLANEYKLWLHTDAAFGGGAILNTRYKHWLKGIEYSDSISIDIHKWLSVQMGTGMFITSNKEVLHRSFTVSAEYMPRDGNELDIVDPYTHSIQWSRRFNGLKIYMSLLVFGWEGYAKTLEHHVEMARFLKEQLIKNGWSIYNNTPLPVICFNDSQLENNAVITQDICERIISSGKAWISVYPINGKYTFRACITNYMTTKKDLSSFVSLISKYRNTYENKREKMKHHIG